MIKKEMIAMLLAGGQGSRLGVLTSKVAKPAVAFGGKYRIIDFPLSNCINSGIDTVGVLTQYQPLYKLWQLRGKEYAHYRQSAAISARLKYPIDDVPFLISIIN